MPKIKADTVLKIIDHKVFAAHVAMHLAREGLILPPLFKNKFKNMKAVDEQGSGKQFLDMHHDLLRGFRYLLDKENSQYLDLLPKWNTDNPLKLPDEIHNLFRNTNRPDYLTLVFEGVKKRVRLDPGKTFTKAADDLGRFIEKGDDNKTPGSGFHDTLHQYLGSMEGGFAKGAEMNKLRESMNNDYFWQLHTWIDAQYVALALKYSKQLPVEALAPQKLKMHGMGGMRIGAAMKKTGGKKMGRNAMKSSGTIRTGGGMKMSKTAGAP
jgi:hypothetical protein